MRVATAVALALALMSLAGCLGDGAEPTSDSESPVAEPPADAPPEPPADGSPSEPEDPTPQEPEPSPNATEPQPPASEEPEAVEPDWGAPEGKGIRPGVNIATEGASCTTSFIFTDSWERYYLSTAAHCVENGGSDQTDGCLAPLHPEGTLTRIDLDTSGSVNVPLAYSSWKVMQDRGDAGSSACAGNDFALLDVTDHLDDVHPASLHFRAPTGLATQATADIWGYGASGLKFGIEVTHPKQGQHLGTARDGWSHLVYLATPGIPGDSGGHIMTSDGQALGIASTVILAPYPAANYYTDIGRAVAYAEATTDLRLQLVTWDDFNASLT